MPTKPEHLNGQEEPEAGKPSTALERLSGTDEVDEDGPPEPKTRLKPSEKERIWQLAFAEGMSQREIARTIGRSRISVRRAIHCLAGVNRRDEIQKEIRERTRTKLVAMADRAVKSWGKQLDLADEGLRANHLPAKDLLTHAGMVDIAVPRTNQGTQILIQIGSDAPVEVQEAVEGIVVDD